MNDENLRKAQLLADQAFDLLMWNDNGDGTTYTPRSITGLDRGKVEDLTALSEAYSMLASAESGDETVEMTKAVAATMATGHGTDRSAGSTRRPAFEAEGQHDPTV